MGRDQPFGVGLVRGEGFLDQKMDSRLEGGEAKWNVLRMRRGNDDGIHRPGLDEVMAVGENLQRLIFFRRDETGTAHGHQFAAAYLALEEVIGVEFADVAHADDAKANFVHTTMFLFGPAPPPRRR